MWHCEPAVNQPCKQGAEWGADRAPIESLQLQQHRPCTCMCASVCPIQYVARSIHGRKGWWNNDLSCVFISPFFCTLSSLILQFLHLLPPAHICPSLSYSFVPFLPRCSRNNSSYSNLVRFPSNASLSPTSASILRISFVADAPPPPPFLKIPFSSDPLPTTTLSTPPLKPGPDNSALPLMHHSWFCSLMHFLSPSQLNHQIFIVGFYDFF